MTDRESPLPDREEEHRTIVPDRDEFETEIEGSSDDTVTGYIDRFATIVRDGKVLSCRQVRYDALVRSDQIGDFRIQRLLGRGSFGAVYLARESSLDRLVALKVVLPEGQRATAGEGRSLARLKHPGIVGVYGEAHDRTSGCSLLWMQFVDGRDLAHVIERLHRKGDDWDESDLERLLNPERNSSESEPDSPRQEPAQWAQQEEAESRRSLEVICRIGHQLAEAVSHAHQSGVTHRDIKPANILMQRDGTPLLADFNLADNANDDRECVSGGTIAYMPPEQLAQLLGEGNSFDAARADVYSLGVVLWELASGRRPYQERESQVTSSGGQRLLEQLSLRREDLPSDDETVPVGLAVVLRRAMRVDPTKRYPSAAAMATALRGLVELQRARRQAPVAAGLLRFIRRHLIWVMLIGGVLPHIAASLLQVKYNQIWIETGDVAFRKAFFAYNIVVYPACVGWFAWNLYRLASGYRNVVGRVPVRRGQLRDLRGRLLKMPRQFTIIAALGWFPGIVLFPWLLSAFGEPPSTSDWYHYGISFAIAGMIATTYSYAIVTYVVVCHGYRACWQTATHYRERARHELSGMQHRISRVAILAGVLPLAAAVLLLAIGMPSIEHLDFEHLKRMRDLHSLVIALIVMGAIGLYVVQTASARLVRVVRALTLADE